MDAHETPLVIGIAGGSGSGKTTVANAILSRVGHGRLAYLPHDAYYRDLKDLPLIQRGEINFDHPDSLETELMIEHIKQPNACQAAELPVYDFIHHARTNQKNRVEPSRVIIV